MQMDLLERVTQKYQIPAIMVDVDYADSRAYHEDTVFENIGILFEMIDGKKNSRSF